jgi:hypothetical protein
VGVVGAREFLGQTPCVLKKRDFSKFRTKSDVKRGGLRGWKVGETVRRVVKFILAAAGVLKMRWNHFFFLGQEVGGKKEKKEKKKKKKICGGWGKKKKKKKKKKTYTTQTCAPFYAMHSPGVTWPILFFNRKCSYLL